MKPDVAVVGAGWSGLAAAVSLLDRSCRVTLIDAAPQVGGRARRVDLALGERTFALDNGQHLLIGAYTEYLALARRVGLEIDARFLVRPFTLRYPDGFKLAASPAPAPLHLAGALLFARGLAWRDRIAAALWVRSWQRRKWSIEHDLPAAALFAAHPSTLITRLWGPLCLAALNVRLEEASARVFLRVLADSLGAQSSASHLYLARGDLSTLLPESAERALRAGGAELLLRETALSLLFDAASSRWRIDLRTRAVDADAVVLAVPPARSAALLNSVARIELEGPIAQLERIATAPIATVYLRYPATSRLPHPVFALDEQPARFDYGQWVFDRGQLEPDHAGVLSVVISGRGAHEALDADTLAGHVAAQMKRCFGLETPLAHAVLVEKRATIVPAVDLVRPAVRLPLPRLYLASDAADSPYPSTLEGSVRSGLAAARLAAEDLRFTAA